MDIHQNSQQDSPFLLKEKKNKFSVFTRQTFSTNCVLHLKSLDDKKMTRYTIQKDVPAL